MGSGEDKQGPSCWLPPWVGLRLEQPAPRPLTFILLGNEAPPSPGAWDGGPRKPALLNRLPNFWLPNLTPGSLPGSHDVPWSNPVTRLSEGTQVAMAAQEGIWAVLALSGFLSLVSETRL